MDPTGPEPEPLPTPAAGGTSELLDDHKLGRLAAVDARLVWSNEASDFTPWLETNIDLLGEALGIIELEAVQREVPVGQFFLDLLAKDAEGRTVVIENQLNPSDHNHLGQLLVYAAGRTASVIVWVTTRFREEYRAVLEWLNEHTDTDVVFFGVEVRAVRIGLSPPAPVFDVVVRPNEWGKAQKAQKQAAEGASTVALARQEFFRRVFEKVAERLPSFRVPRPSLQNWASFKAGPFGYYALSFSQNGLRVEAYLDSGNKQANKLLFDELHADQEQIHLAFGQQLSWERISDRRASRIAVYWETRLNFEDEVESAAAVAWSAEHAVRFIEVLDQRLRTRARELKVNLPSDGEPAEDDERAEIPS